MRAAAQLHDVENVEAFCSRILDIVLRGNGGYLRPDQREEAESYLVLVCVEQSHVWKPGAVTFSKWAAWIVQRRMTDWYRSNLGDTRAHSRRPMYVSYDELAGDAERTPGTLVADSHENEVLTRVALR